MIRGIIHNSDKKPSNIAKYDKTKKRQWDVEDDTAEERIPGKVSTETILEGQTS